MKTSNTILSDIYTIVKASPIDALNGGIYKKTRPTDSMLEDCIINLIAGTTAKFLQDGAIYIKIYYLDINQNNTYYEDATNGSILETLLLDLSETLLNTSGYSFDVQSRETIIEPMADVHQHFVTLKINFQLTNN